MTARCRLNYPLHCNYNTYSTSLSPREPLHLQSWLQPKPNAARLNRTLAALSESALQVAPALTGHLFCRLWATAVA